MNIFVATLWVSFFSSAGLWKVNVKQELVDAKNAVKKSVVEFKNAEGKVVTYSPEAMPWGFYASKDIAVQGRSYVVTYWADGSRSVHYRLFDPDVSNVPVCEFSTESEKPRFRFFKGELQYQDVSFGDDPFSATAKKKLSWLPCKVLKKASAKGAGA